MGETGQGNANLPPPSSSSLSLLHLSDYFPTLPLSLGGAMLT